MERLAQPVVLPHDGFSNLRRIAVSATPEPKPEAELVKVFDTQQESEAMIVRGLLTSAGIESMVTSIDADQALWPGVGGVVVMVNPEQANEARSLIEEYNDPGAELEDLADEQPEEPA
jgi:hypothetical protein